MCTEHMNRAKTRLAPIQRPALLSLESSLTVKGYVMEIVIRVAFRQFIELGVEIVMMARVAPQFVDGLMRLVSRNSTTMIVVVLLEYLL